MTTITFIVLSLATWRISSLLVNEDGPLHVFLRLRKLVGIQYAPDGFKFMVPDTFLAGVLDCVWCCSMWVGTGWFVFWYFLPSIAALVALPFAFSTGAIIVDVFTKKLQGV